MKNVEIDDWIEFTNLATRLGFALDDGDADAWVDCFTSDGSFVMPEDTYQGEARLRELVAERENLPRIQRWTASLVVSSNDGKYRAEANGVVIEDIGGVPQIGGFALQQYDFRQVDGRWLVECMTVVRPRKDA